MERVNEKPEQTGESPTQTNDQKSGFTVIDKRPWAEGAEVEAATGTTEAPAEGHRYPSFVEELLEKLQEKDRQLREFIASYKEQAKRENEEFRKRLTREMERQIESAKANLVRPFLDVLDNLDRALAHATIEGQLDPLLQGVESIRGQFLSVLRDLGVQRLSRCGQVFNPEIDEALQVVVVEEAEKDNLVLEEIQPAYTLNDKLIRPALVKVGKVSQG
ncbi:MAG: nucleotide exchange factor GrpE [Candidatus Tectomicrobia bacterium]|uniref:Protein GrpE n=1 Tax=Tectimicrobiota bacterium TaxID=2528274 RepID=A0A932CLG8_UNCTE|nr:nucleotide exchange factor GrpE [Candidatus Tectomicrobia bacterium]